MSGLISTVKEKLTYFFPSYTRHSLVYVSFIFTVYLVSEGKDALAAGGGAGCQAEALTGAGGVAVAPTVKQVYIVTNYLLGSSHYRNVLPPRIKILP